MKVLIIFGWLILMNSCEQETKFTNLDESVTSEREDKHGVFCGTDIEVNQIGDSSGEIDSRQRVFDQPAISLPCEVADLTVTIGNCFNNLPLYLQAIQDAIDAYNNVPNTGINMDLVPGPNADIILDCFNQNCVGGTILGGFADQFYDNNNATNSLMINTNLGEMQTCCGMFNLCDLTALFIHEIGHVIGFDHTNDPIDEDALPSSIIDGTPEDDANSIFNGNSLCAGICNFSPNDITALQTLYPCACPPGDITGPGCAQVVNQTVQYCIDGDWDNITWNIPNPFTIVGGQGNPCIQIALSNSFLPGRNISVDVTQGGCEYSVSRFIETGRPNFDITYNAPVCRGDVVTFRINQLPNGQNLSSISWNVGYGGLNIMSQSYNFAVAEALDSGNSQICATATNSCGIQHTYCRIVAIDQHSDCTGDGDIPNPE